MTALALRHGDPVRVLAPAEFRGREGAVAVPLWTPEEGVRRIGVRLTEGARVVWVTAVELLVRERVQVG